MKKFFFGTMLLALVAALPAPSMAEVNVHIGFALPPPIAVPAPPPMVVLPYTNYVYAAPDIEVDLFFWDGWWWRPWEGRWYRSHYYDRGWVYYDSVPRFYYDVDPSWRNYYHDHRWNDHSWRYQAIPHNRLKQNWSSWQHTRYWTNQRMGVEHYKPYPPHERQQLRQQREHEYRQRPEVQRHLQQRQQQKQHHKK
jgi:hypothetical protein